MLIACWDNYSETPLREQDFLIKTTVSVFVNDLGGEGENPLQLELVLFSCLRSNNSFLWDSGSGNLVEPWFVNFELYRGSIAYGSSPPGPAWRWDLRSKSLPSWLQAQACGWCGTLLVLHSLSLPKSQGARAEGAYASVLVDGCGWGESPSSSLCFG